MTSRDRRTGISVAFLFAVALHAAAGFGLSHMLSNRNGIYPVFSIGTASVSLTLVQPRPAVVEPAKPVEQAPAVQPTPAAEPVPPAPDTKPDQITPEKPVSAQPDSNDRTGGDDVSETAPDSDSNLSQQGVESLYVGLSDIRPSYPIGSRMRGEEGVVAVDVQVNSSGHAQDIEVTRSSGHPALDHAAIDAVKKARFVTRDGTGPAAKLALSFRFKLTD